MRSWLLMLAGLMGSVVAQADPFAAGVACPIATLADYVASSGGCTFGSVNYSAFSASGTVSASAILVTPASGLGTGFRGAGEMFGFVFTGISAPLYASSSGAARLSFGYVIGTNRFEPFWVAEYGITAQGAHAGDFLIDTTLSTVVNGLTNNFRYYTDSSYYGTTAGGRARQGTAYVPIGDLTGALSAGNYPTMYAVNTDLRLNATNNAYSITSLDQSSLIFLSTPEPSSVLLLATGLLAFIGIRRK